MSSFSDNLSYYTKWHMDEGNEPSGYICSQIYCSAEYYQGFCGGTHYDYYDEPHGSLVQVYLNGGTRYLSIEGFRVLYDHRLYSLGQTVQRFQARNKRKRSDPEDDPPERGAKRLAERLTKRLKSVPS
jgi:hypothetical protein